MAVGRDERITKRSGGSVLPPSWTTLLDHQVVSVEAGKVIVFANHRIGEELAKLPPATGTKGQLAGSEPGKRGKGKKGGSGRSRKKQPDKSAPTLKESVGSRTRGTRLKKLGNTPKDVVEAAVEKLADEGKDITGDQRERCCGSEKGGTTRATIPRWGQLFFRWSAPIPARGI